MSSIVEKYEQILAADPRSRIFVELAKALVDRGEHARAVEVCRRGLEHHPSSILGRVIWGRALLEGGDTKGATDQFDIAIALEPASPYAFNLVGEALLKKGLHREALPVLARAAELQPADARVKGWLDEARRRAASEPEGAAAAPTAPARVAGDGADAGEEKTEPYRPIGTMGPAVPARGAAPGLARPAAASSAGAGERIATPASGAPVASGTPAPGASASAQSPRGGAPAKVNGAGMPPPLPPGATRAPRRNDAQNSLLHMIPGATRDMPAARPSRTGIPAAHAEADPAEAARIARQ